MKIKVKEGCIKVNSINTKIIANGITFIHIDLKAKHAEIDCFSGEGIYLTKKDSNEFSSGTIKAEEGYEYTVIEFPDGSHLQNFVIDNYTLSGFVFNENPYNDFDDKNSDWKQNVFDNV